MPAARAKNDGMGSLLYDDGSCRFRVWAPFAKSVSVEGDFTGWATGAVALNDEGNGNWSGVIPGVKALALYKYRIENIGGPGNDNSRIWEQADARALQVEKLGVRLGELCGRPLRADRAARLRHAGLRELHPLPTARGIVRGLERSAGGAGQRPHRHLPRYHRQASVHPGPRVQRPGAVARRGRGCRPPGRSHARGLRRLRHVRAGGPVRLLAEPRRRTTC